VVNKSDKPGAEDTVRDISHYVDGRSEDKGWKIPVLGIQANTGDGVGALKNELDARFSYLKEDPAGIEKKKERLKGLMFSLLKEEMWNTLMDRWATAEGFEHIVAQLKDRKIDPYAAAHEASEMMFSRQ